MPSLTLTRSPSFLSRSSLPDDPEARRLEKRGRWWLVLSYVLCPCHLPITLPLLGVAFGGTALGATVLGNTAVVGGALVALYGVVLWRGFRSLRRAKRLAGPGGRIDCSTGACEITPASPPGPPF